MYIFNTWYNIIETYIYNKTIQIPINMININTTLDVNTIIIIIIIIIRKYYHNTINNI